MTSYKQRMLLAAAKEANGILTLDEAVNLIGGNIYHNAKKHTGALLSNMVRRGMLERVKPGVFRVATKHQEKHEQPEML